MGEIICAFFWKQLFSPGGDVPDTYPLMDVAEIHSVSLLCGP